MNILGYGAILVGLFLVFFHNWINKHTKTKNEYLQTRFFGSANLIPVGCVLIVLGLVVLIFF